MFPLLLIVIGATLLGHAALWTSLYNRLHATDLRCRVVRIVEKIAVLLLGLAGLGLLYTMATRWPRVAGSTRSTGDLLLLGYSILCWTLLAWVASRWAWYRWAAGNRLSAAPNHTDRMNLPRELGFLPVRRGLPRWVAALPGNQVLDVHFQHKVVPHPRLPGALDGLKIVQLTDLHLTGLVEEAFFARVVARVNQWQPDLVALTGDLVESVACLDWIPRTVGRLRSRFGTFFVLGNHDRRLSDPPALRRCLAAAGCTDLGGRWRQLSWHGAPLLLGGNECPWFPPAPRPPAEMRAADAGRPFSIVLAHTPDQLPWARRQGVDLILAGHTHGGQIRFPGIGAVVCPSRFGVRYASGLFSEPPTVLHVSRGLSGVQLLRFGCPPEVTLLELTCATP